MQLTSYTSNTTMGSMKATHLGELEQKIMNIVWQKKNVSARDVLTEINTEKILAYTTVATILQRLIDKGLLNRKEDKTGYVYYPKITRESYTKKVAQSFLNHFIDSFGDAAIASFADSIDKLSEKKRKYFLELIENHDKNK